MSFEFKMPEEELAKLRLPEQTRRVGFGSRRLYVGGLLGVLAVAVLVRSFVFDTGYDSALVADLGVVRAPTGGVVGDLSANVGDRVARGQALGVFTVPVGLSAAVRAGSENVDQLTAALASIDARYATLKAGEAQIRSEASTFRQQKSAQLSAVGDAASADIAATDARLAYARVQLKRIRSLADKGFVTTATLDKAVQDMRDATASRAAAVAQRRAAAIETSAAGKGMLLSSGYSDVQYSTQRLSDMTLALVQLQGQRDAIAAQLASARQPAATANRRMTMPLAATVSGRVWSRLAAPGETVKEGDPIYSLADCSSFFAYFLVGRSTYSKLTIGRPVTFASLAGGQRWKGSIVNLGTTDSGALRLTSQVPAPRDGSYLVGARIALPPADQQSCPVGVAGRVVL
jgi:multidrug resistance efflux pump